MGFKIPSARRNGRTANADDFRIAFGRKGKLPDGAAPAVLLGGVYIYLKPAADPVPYNYFGKTRFLKSSKHRVFAICPDCQAHVPAGRSMQHKCKLPKE